MTRMPEHPGGAPQGQPGRDFLKRQQMSDDKNYLTIPATAIQVNDRVLECLWGRVVKIKVVDNHVEVTTFGGEVHWLRRDIPVTVERPDL